MRSILQFPELLKRIVSRKEKFRLDHQFLISSIKGIISGYKGGIRLRLLNKKNHPRLKKVKRYQYKK
jgi:hypothetical protein